MNNFKHNWTDNFKPTINNLIAKIIKILFVLQSFALKLYTIITQKQNFLCVFTWICTFGTLTKTVYFAVLRGRVEDNIKLVTRVNNIVFKLPTSTYIGTFQTFLYIDHITFFYLSLSSFQNWLYEYRFNYNLPYKVGRFFFVCIEWSRWPLNRYVSSLQWTFL